MPTTFLKKQNPENDTPTYFAIDADKIETLNLCETRDDYGKPVGHSDAGDYHLATEGCDAIPDCKAAIAEKFGIDIDLINLFNEGNDTFVIEPGDGELYGFNEEEVNSFIMSWAAENENLSTVSGFNYWDGHNHRTVIIDSEWYDAPYTIVTDATLMAELAKAIEDMTKSGTGVGYNEYQGNGYSLVESYWEGAWAQYEITPVRDEDHQ